MTLRAFATISLSALRHNFHQVKKLAPNSRIMAMTKANAYGHGLLRIAQALSEADAFGVATLEEALNLRQANITKPIVVMSGFSSIDELTQMAAQKLTAVIHQDEQISMLQKTELSSPISIWFKVDTGMHRLGFVPQQVQAAYAQLVNNVNVAKPIGWMTHLACSDEPNSAHTLQQITQFSEFVANEKLRSIACSSAIIAWPQTHVEWIRPGIMLYGVSPFSNRLGSEFGLRPVMTLSARLMAIKHLQPGDSIGYGATWIASGPTKIGIVSIGYGDGYPRQAKNGTPVLVNGKRCSLAGRVSMDLLSIDLTNEPNAKVGDEVILWGEGLPIEEVAQCAGTIGYELLCKVTTRVPFKTL